MKKRFPILILAGFLLALVFGTSIVLVNADSPQGSSTNYSIPWDAISGGGNEMASANYAIKSTTGQTTIGAGSSSNYSIRAGYWYGLTQRVYDFYLPLILKSLVP